MFGAITGALGVAKSVGGLFGGGGPRQPRMNRAQKQQLKSQTNLNNAMAKLMRVMAHKLREMHGSMLGRRAGHPNGQCSCHGMNGAYGHNQMGSNMPININIPANMANLPINVSLGNPQAGLPMPNIAAQFSAGVSMFA